jgi:ADP-ribosylation factor 2-binding protein
MSASSSEQQQQELGLGGDEDIVVAASTNAEDARFDEVVGAIEEIIMEDEFQAIQDDFMTKNYKHFEDSDENKLIYTTVHNEYVSLVEKYLDGALKRKVKGFDMDSFLGTLVERKEELEGEIFELLLTFDDFLEFKQLMLSFKSVSDAFRIYWGFIIIFQGGFGHCPKD